MNALTINELLNTPAKYEAIPQYITETDTNGKTHVYTYDHTALTNGYVRKNATCKPIPYNGNFGVGYTINVNNPQSTRYALKVYYVEISSSVVCASNDNCTLCPLYVQYPYEHCLFY